MLACLSVSLKWYPKFMLDDIMHWSVLTLIAPDTLFRITLRQVFNCALTKDINEYAVCSWIGKGAWFYKNCHFLLLTAPFTEQLLATRYVGIFFLIRTKYTTSFSSPGSKVRRLHPIRLQSVAEYSLNVTYSELFTEQPIQQAEIPNNEYRNNNHKNHKLRL